MPRTTHIEENNQKRSETDTRQWSYIRSGRCNPLDEEIRQVMDRVPEEQQTRPILFSNPQLVQKLTEEGFSYGLSNMLLYQSKSVALRIWLIDNSGSMNQNDGHRVTQISGKNRISTVNCTRWEEVTSTVMWHTKMSAIIEAPIVFRFLNDPGCGYHQQFSVGKRTREYIPEEVKTVEKMMRKTRPSGPSYLVEHLKEVYVSLATNRYQLEKREQIATLIIVTDGIPTDEFGEEGEFVKNEFLEVLQEFSNLPVWVVIRLVTDDDRVINFYNSVDEHFTNLDCDLNVDVLDDWINEAKEVYEHNPWLTYALSLHLCRESGITFGEFDALDERPLSLKELQDMCNYLFDISPEEAHPDPRYDWSSYLYFLRKVMEKQKHQWDPIKEKVTPWINFKELDRIYGGNVSQSTGCNCAVS